MCRMNEHYVQIVDANIPSLFLCVDAPLSLQQLSRLALRKKLGTRALRVIGQLHIPKLLISYLCYQ